MAQAMYYFIPKSNDIKMAHYNNEITDTFLWAQEDFLGDSDKKNRFGFAVFNIYVRPFHE